MIAPTHVLVVDDKEENRYFLEALLGGHGHTVRSARHGEEALVLARESPPDVVISDLLMPVMDGYTLLRHWKADERLYTVPFIVYTATYTEAEDEKLALDLGADAFILKPAEPEEFLARLAEVLQRAAIPHGAPSNATRGDEVQLLEVYSKRLIRKLEAKSLQLEQANHALREDIARREAAEAREHLLSDRLAATLESISDAMLMLDRDWRVTYMNRQAERLLQRDRDTLVGRNLWQEYPDAIGSIFDREYRRAMTQHSSVEFTEFYPLLQAWLNVRAYPVEDGLAIYFRDVTEKRALEARLQQSHRLEAIGQMTGGIAHDFNNLLTVILGSAESLGEQFAHDPRARGVARMITAAAQRGAQLTQRLLAFARKQMLDPEPVDLNRLVEDMDTLLHRTLGEHIEIAPVRCGSLWPALVDPAQIESALLNLAINARDAMPHGGRLTIETANAALDDQFAQQHIDVAPGDYVLLAVSDTGTGIPAEIINRVFEPFFTTKETGKGSGLGLAMVHGLVKQSGGHVSIYSEPGHGTSVKLYLPRADREAVPARGDGDDSVIGGDEIVLLVEDDELVRRYAFDQLRSLGYQVIEAEHGPRALAILRGDAAIDLLFSDVVMPGGMSGPDLALEAKKLRPGLGVLFTSGYTEASVVQHTRLEPGTQLLPKPWRRGDLASKIRAALDLRE